jgi:hypothetical protein
MGIFVSWITTVVFGYQSPIKFGVSIWEPKTLFPTDLTFSLDEISWPLMVTIIATVLVAFMTSPSRKNVDVREQITVLIYASASLTTVLSDNLLTIITTWMVADSFVLLLAIIQINQAKPKPGFTGCFVKSLASIFMLIIASGLHMGSGGDAHFSHPLQSTPAILTILFSFILRIPILTEKQCGAQLGWVDRASIAVLDIFPALAGIALIGRLFKAGIPEDAFLWMSIMGTLMMISGILRFQAKEPSRGSLSDMILAVSGIGLLAASISPENAAPIIVGYGAVILLLGTTHSFLTIHESWHNIVYIFFIATMVGMPGTIGNRLSHQISASMSTKTALGISILVSLGTISLGVGFLRSTLAHKQEWRSAETISRISYSSGWLVLTMAAFLANLPDLANIATGDILYFLIMGTLITAILFGTKYVDMNKYLQIVEKIAFPKVRMRTDIIKEAYEGFKTIMRGFASLFEGETGMLWVFVILVLLILAIGGS